jgi:phospholipid/cholesterol/gamma-HCH transport system ATP-binding protein
MSTDDALITIRDLYFRRGRRVIFDGIDLNIPRGSITAILGPSGTGKTTLLRLISGQLLPERGTVVVDGENVAKLSRADLFELRRRMGMLFQSGALLTDLDVYENIAFPLREHTRLPESLIRTLVLMKLELVGLRGAYRLRTEALSGGMARRVALARAIILDPMMIMYDEPFVGLDPISMGVIVRLVKRLNEALGLTSIIVTHDVKEVITIADYCYLIADGKIMGAGSPAALLKSDSAWVRQFMEGLDDGPVPFHYPAPPYLEQLLETKS